METREIVSEKIRQNYNVKSALNLFVQEIRQIIRPQSRSSRPEYACLKPKGHQTLLYLFYFRLGKGLLSQDFYFVSGIINYNFGLSAFTFPKSGVKINIFLHVQLMGKASWFCCNYWLLLLVSTTPVVNLLPGSLTMVVHLKLRKSPWIFEKIQNGAICIIRCLREDIEYIKGNAVLYRDFVTIPWAASLQYINKLANSQSQKPRSPLPQIII